MSGREVIIGEIDADEDERSSMLRVEGAVRRYGGIEALRGVNFDLLPGEVHALVGENGAGKSTLIKLIAGSEIADEGTIEYFGNEARIAVVHQELAVVLTMTVLDNLFLGTAKSFFVRRSRLKSRARELLDAVGLGHISSSTRASELSLAERQLIEIARALGRDAAIIILDEPTATLTDVEVERVLRVVSALRDDGRAVIYVSHRLQEIFTLADRVTTLRNGALVSTDAVAELTNRALVAKMLGDENASHDLSRQALGAIGEEERLQVRGLTARRLFSDIDFEVRQGEICCLTGQIGSGADSLIRSLAGLQRWDAGTIVIGDVALTRASVQSARSAGAAYVPSDRANEGVFLDATVEANISSGILKPISTAGVIRARLERTRTQDLAKSMAIDTTRMTSLARHLSGGNQQKVAITKAVASEPRVLVLDEPTRGVDIGARREIYDQLRGLASDGMTIVCYTSDMSEVRHFADTVVTLYRGRMVRRASVAETSDAEILADILHGGEEASRG